MYYQNEPGIYVYYYDIVYRDAPDILGTRKVVCRRYETIGDFLWAHSEYNIKENCGYSIDDKICRAVTNVEYSRGYCRRRYVRNKTYCNKINCQEHDDDFYKAYVVYDQDGNFYSPDRLIGLRREWEGNRKSLYWPWFPGRKRGAYGWFRPIRTFQERKWAHAWDDEEFPPKVRAARQGKNLPNSWDDICRHNDKSWKTQSKRKHQWKSK